MIKSDNVNKSDIVHKKNLYKRFIASIVLLIFTSFLYSAETTMKIEPYTEDEFPDWAHGLRRAEIVSLGSLPFTTLTVSLGYSIYRYIDKEFDPAFFPNPLAKSSNAANLNTEEQKGILISALCLSVAVGITDFIISLVQSNMENKAEEEKQKEQRKSIIIESEAQ